MPLEMTKLLGSVYGRMTLHIFCSEARRCAAYKIYSNTQYTTSLLKIKLITVKRLCALIYNSYIV